VSDTYDLAALKAQMRQETGETLYPQRTPENRLILGIGRDISAGISRTESHFMWTNDVTAAATALDRTTPFWRRLHPAHQRTLLGVVTGQPGVLPELTPMLAALERGQTHAAAAHLGRTTWARARPRAYANAIERLKLN
jgi:hypothetical protein